MMAEGQCIKNQQGLKLSSSQWWFESHSHKASPEHSRLPHNKCWCCSCSDVIEFTSPRQWEVILCLAAAYGCAADTERHGENKGEEGSSRQRQQRGHFENLDANVWQTASLDLFLALILFLIHRRLAQPFEAVHNRWSLGPNLSPRSVHGPPQTAPAGCQQRSGRLSLLQRDS